MCNLKFHPMKYFLHSKIKDKHYKLFDYAIIIIIAIIPLFASFNYRINIFLSWEGAYRMSMGEVPFRDFGLPLGFGYFLVPALFFKIFGAQFVSLIKAQVLLNIFSGLAFRKILKNFNVQKEVVSLGVLTYAISYTFMNAWPWYNHTVIVYQLIGLAFITSSYSITNRKNVAWRVIFGTFFIILSIFTKQDAGILGFFIAFFVTLTFSFLTKQWAHFIYFTGASLLIATLIIKSLNPSFFYWFNHGQAPHSSRLSLYDILDEFFRGSQWIRFYLIAIILAIIHSVQKKNQVTNLQILFLLFTLGILTEAAIFQVTSYVPEDNNIFFHSFAITFLLWYIVKNEILLVQKIWTFSTLTLCILLFWTVNYWKYIDRFAVKFKPKDENISSTGENIVNKNNYIKDTYRAGTVPSYLWKECGWYSLEDIKIPQSTIGGINRLKAMPEMKGAENKKILNMSELSFLAHDIGFKLETGSGYPLWQHLGVGMFNKQLHMFQNRIANHYYDVVIYEYLPHLNNFYPLVLHDQLKKDYVLKDEFLAPRDPTNSNIEVYVKK